MSSYNPQLDVFFIIKGNIDNPLQSTKYTGNNLNIVSNNISSEKNIFIKSKSFEHLAFELKNNEIIIHSTTANKIPLYVRVKDSIFKISNAPHLLFDINENIEIDPFVIINRLFYFPSAYNNMFTDIKMLEASAIYIINKTGLHYKESKLKKIEEPSRKTLLENLVSEYEELAKTGQPFLIPISDGTDSRMDLVLSYNAAKKYGNELKLFHLTSDNNSSNNIVKQIEIILNNKNIKNNIYYINKSTAYKEGLKLINNQEAILYQAGNLKRTIFSYNYLAEFMKQSYPDGIMLGFNENVYKGRWYDWVKNIDNDMQIIHSIPYTTLFEMSKNIEFYEINKELYDKNHFFQDIILHSKVYNESTSRIDFINYQIEDSNKLCRQNHFTQYFDVKGPMLQDFFISNFFSLPKRYKYANNFAQYLFDNLSPEFNIKYHSSSLNYQYTSPNKFINFKNIRIKQITKNIKYYLSPILFLKDNAPYTKWKNINSTNINERYYSIKIEKQRELIEFNYKSSLGNFLKKIYIQNLSNVDNNMCLFLILYIYYLENSGFRNINFVKI